MAALTNKRGGASGGESLIVDIDEGNLSEADCDVKIDIVKKTMADE